MADITLAECNGGVWLVGGENHLMDLLGNTLPQGVSIELVPCERKSDVTELWHQLCGAPDGGRDPWIINPAIVARIRRSAPGQAIYFAQWSAALDADALAVIGSAASWALEHPDAPVAIVDYCEADASSSLRVLGDLRVTLITERLVADGLPRERIAHERGAPPGEASASSELQRVDIVVRTG